MWNKRDSAEVMVFTTWTPTSYAVPTLMHDHTYRMGIAWQNTAYNQPPHLGYYLPDYIDGKLETLGVKSVATQSQPAEEVFDLQGRPRQTLRPGVNIIRSGNSTHKVIVR